MAQALTASVSDADDPRCATRDRLVMAHVGLVKTLANRLSYRLPRQVERADLVSVGVVGLIDAAGRYKPSLGVPFDAFARRRVQGAMLDSLRDADWAPRSVRRLRREVDATIGHLRRQLRREPESSEIAAQLGVSDDEYARMLNRLRGTDAETMHAAAGAEGVNALDAAIDPGEEPHARLERLEWRRRLAEALARLPHRERRVVVLSYQHGLTLDEIGRIIGVGESRVSQLRTQAIARLRSMLAPLAPPRSRWPRH